MSTKVSQLCINCMFSYSKRDKPGHRHSHSQSKTKVQQYKAQSHWGPKIFCTPKDLSAPLFWLYLLQYRSLVFKAQASQHHPTSATVSPNCCVSPTPSTLSSPKLSSGTLTSHMVPEPQLHSDHFSPGALLPLKLHPTLTKTFLGLLVHVL